MSVIERSGIYGTYYGSPWGESSVCSKEQMRVNAVYIYHYLANKGWTIQAISGMLGNMQVESSINPGRWQNDNVGNGPAYGIVQWDPFSKYISWCEEQGYSDPSEMDNNLARIIYELNNGLQWISTSSYDLSFSEFTKSTESPFYLAGAFLLNYERPADQSQEVIEYRGSLGESAYLYLLEVLGENPEPIEPVKKSKRRKFKFILYNKRRRIYGQRKIY